jgi:hypothetical protein
MTFPVNYEDTPSAKNWIGTPADDPTSVTYEEGIYIGYRYFNTLTYNLLMNLDTDYRIPHSIILIIRLENIQRQDDCFCYNNKFR